MRRNLFTVVMVTVGIVSAKFNFGPCPFADLPQMAYSDYLPDDDVAVGYYHDITGIDRGIADLIDALQVLGFEPPLNYKCDDLGTISPWKEIAKA